MIAIRGLLLGLTLGVTSCPAPADKPVGPVSEKTTMPWNPPVPGQGAGPMGQLPQQPRR
jgi:hypothetical protein